MTDQRDLAKEVERIVATAEQHGDNTIYSLSDIKTLLLQIASQSRELEELRKLNIQLGTARQPVGHPAWVDAVRNRALHYPDGAMLDDIYALLGQVDELRRPVALGDELEAIRKEWKQDIASLQEAIRAGYVEQGDITDAAVAVNTLLSALDQAQQDNIRYRNAHKILLAERDEARQSLQQESELHQARKDLVVQLTSERDEARGKVERIGKLCESLTAESVRLIKDKASQANRIERLEGAKNTCVVLLQQLHQRLWDLGLCQTSISRTLLDEAISALAAADGQQPAPEQSLIETTRRSPRVVDAGNLRDAADGQQQRRDELNAKFRGRPRLRGPEDDFKAPAEDQPSATGDGVEGE